MYFLNFLETSKLTIDLCLKCEEERQKLSKNIDRQPLKIISLSVTCWLKHYRNYLVFIKMADEKSSHQSPAKKKKQVKNTIYSLYFFAATYLFVSFYIQTFYLF